MNLGEDEFTITHQTGEKSIEQATASPQTASQTGPNTVPGLKHNYAHQML